ncbi:DNA-directed RNA polymerase I, subunit RPA34.5 [Choanephora cucurbitarum]|nr:DNA-directed RNA polymerase I, subunit RPA34.5 [Choanephora cucurbitarum]
MTISVPKDFKPALSKFDSAFDKETLLDDDNELWLIRIPDNLSESDLTHIKFKTPGEKATKKPLGKFEKEDDTYTLYKVPTAQHLKSESDSEELSDDQLDLGISGHEMLSFHCLVPSREHNGQFVFAPKPFDQYLILNETVDIPDTTPLAHSILNTPVYKREQPEGLQMRFKPYGYYSEEPVVTKRKRVGSEEEVEEKKVKKEKKDKIKKEKKSKKEKK